MSSRELVGARRVPGLLGGHGGNGARMEALGLLVVVMGVPTLFLLGRKLNGLQMLLEIVVIGCR